MAQWISLQNCRQSSMPGIEEALKLWIWSSGWRERIREMPQREVWRIRVARVPLHRVNRKSGGGLARQAIGSLSVACFAWLLMAASGEAGGYTRARPMPHNRETALTFSVPVIALSWSPVEERLVYVIGDEVRDWPAARRLKLPKELTEEHNKDVPLAWTMKWRQDGQELVVMLEKTDAAVIDVKRFRIEKILRQVQSVWWSGQQLCRLPVINPERFKSTDRPLWYCGRKRCFGPDGWMLMDVSPDGQAMFARVARPAEPGLFNNLVLCKRNQQSGRVEWTKRLYPHSKDVLEGGATDSVVWNERLQRAAVVEAGDTGGGLGVSRLHVVTRHTVLTVDREQMPQYAGVTLVGVRCQPSWVGNKLLAVLDAVSAYPERTEHKVQLVLVHPGQRSAQILLEHSGLLAASAFHAGRTIAYSLLEGKRSKLVISRVLLSQPRARRAAFHIP
jgi:hypothetical protein